MTALPDDTAHSSLIFKRKVRGPHQPISVCDLADLHTDIQRLPDLMVIYVSDNAVGVVSWGSFDLYTTELQRPGDRFYGIGTLLDLAGPLDQDRLYALLARQLGSEAKLRRTDNLKTLR
ncbi:hypothetical protein MF271_18950 (plasmid) [Deinococcus sp. KNUC1210]|uniref:hypothetical protein n=1 Tax=Deinococcus sp. KNUC1210 TaxID=2917691 RepID=UPI001EF0CF06|nr:hypothetical protein [Deinococcus sp. KNUC1210]ULH17400.1 hypothetical protein MF271_18950 [Deinococcus sp. KNUC1210]